MDLLDGNQKCHCGKCVTVVFHSRSGHRLYVHDRWLSGISG